MNNNLQLVETIADRITNSSQYRITFAEYMELVLYHPQFGYYASNAERIGQSGDFLTSPH
jgi:SAM-dependent MidA family methyltransferase